MQPNTKFVTTSRALSGNFQIAGVHPLEHGRRCTMGKLRWDVTLRRAGATIKMNAITFCGEIRINHWYRCAMQWHTEPVIRYIYTLIARDETRHGSAYLQYMKRALNTVGESARMAFAKVGVLIASSGHSGKPLHPTSLHVNKSLFPHDTVQSRLPDPAWLERWLDEQICFTHEWEQKVVTVILHNLSLLFGRKFGSVKDLNRFRKGMAVA